jgi:hypothetical protein
VRRWQNLWRVRAARVSVLIGAILTVQQLVVGLLLPALYLRPTISLPAVEPGTKLLGVPFLISNDHYLTFHGLSPSCILESGIVDTTTNRGIRISGVHHFEPNRFRDLGYGDPPIQFVCDTPCTAASEEPITHIRSLVIVVRVTYRLFWSLWTTTIDFPFTWYETRWIAGRRIN